MDVVNVYMCFRSHRHRTNYVFINYCHMVKRCCIVCDSHSWKSTLAGIEMMRMTGKLAQIIIIIIISFIASIYLYEIATQLDENRLSSDENSSQPRVACIRNFA